MPIAIVHRGCPLRLRGPLHIGIERNTLSWLERSLACCFSLTNAHHIPSATRFSSLRVMSILTAVPSNQGLGWALHGVRAIFMTCTLALTSCFRSCDTSILSPAMVVSDDAVFRPCIRCSASWSIISSPTAYRVCSWVRLRGVAHVGSRWGWPQPYPM
jgi:hypothetical protein